MRSPLHDAASANLDEDVDAMAAEGAAEMMGACCREDNLPDFPSQKPAAVVAAVIGRERVRHAIAVDDSEGVAQPDQIGGFTARARGRSGRTRRLR